MVKYQLEVNTMEFATLRVLINKELKTLRNFLLNSYDKEMSIITQNNIKELEGLYNKLNESKLIL